jgi:uncharacterized membrane protein YozB (DUF420 family)
MKLPKGSFYVVLLLLAVPLSINALSYLNLDTQYGFLRLKKDAIATGWYLPAYYGHVIIAAIILLIGFFQVHPTFGLRWRKTHRLLGKVYVGGILLFSAPGGLVMSMFIDRGPVVQASFVLQCSLWFMFTWLAFVRIRQRDIQAHRRWMLRSFALTLAAITLRVYVFLGSLSFDLAQPTAYATIAWLSWVPNIVVCELYLRASNRPIYS